MNPAAKHPRIQGSLGNAKIDSRLPYRKEFCLGFAILTEESGHVPDSYTFAHFSPVENSGPLRLAEVLRPGDGKDLICVTNGPEKRNPGTGWKLVRLVRHF